MKYTSLLSFILVINESDPWLAKIKKKIKNMKKMELWESFLFFGQFENNLKKKNIE